MPTLAKQSKLLLVVALVVLLIAVFARGAEAASSRSAQCLGEGSSTDDKLDCLVRLVREFEYRQEPIPQQPLEQWPGNDACVSCHFLAGLLVSLSEIFLLSLPTVFFLLVLWENYAPRRNVLPTSDEVTVARPAQTASCSRFWFVLCIIGYLFSALGWLYWFIIFSTFWNFISWTMTSGLIVIAPGLIAALYYKNRTTRRQAILRRLKLAGWTLGLICLIMFPNLKRLPQQVYRRFNPSSTVILPNDPLVLQLKQEFFQQVPDESFHRMTFQEKMLAVDEFIYREIQWKSDMSQYGLVGLLTSAREVIERRAGDCQGQAVTTASLLLSMGYQAWVVETPFHWWTHAEDNETGQFYNLNTHGSAGTQGSVLPQPIDLVYTAPALACTNCSYIDSHNTSPTLYVAPPWLALPIAYTGAHIFKRSSLTLETVDWVQLYKMATYFALGAALYGQYFQADLSQHRFFARFAFAVVMSWGPVFTGMCFWASVYYQVTFMHLVATITFVFSFVSSDLLHKTIGGSVPDDA